MPTTTSRSTQREGYSEDPVISTRNHATPCNYSPHSNEMTYKYVKAPDYPESFEIITPNSEGSNAEWKSFEHYKRVLGDPPAAVGSRLGIGSYDSNHRYANVWSDPMMGQNDYATSGGGPMLYGKPGIWDKTPDLELLYVPESGGSFVPLPLNLTELKELSLKTMLPIIKADLSVVNSIYELKDFKSLARNVTDVRRLTSRLRSIKAWKRGKVETLRQLFRGNASGYLQAQFNILPLLSDISSIYAALSRSERRLNDFITREGRPQNKHFVYKWYELPESTFDDVKTGTCRFRYQKYPTMSSFTYTFISKIRRWTFAKPTTFHAQIQYNFNYTEYQREHARMLAWLDTIGVNLNPQIIWNAIPWSFVVDWVIGVNRWLGQFAITNMEPKINIRRYLWSVKREREIIVEHQLHDSYVLPNAYTSWVPYPIVYETAYRRQVGLPTVSSILSSGLTLKEISLGAALVISRKRKR